MPRPHSTPGGRPRRITIRLSEAERTELDRLRGDVKTNDYIRARLFAPEKPVQVAEKPKAARRSHQWATVDGEGRCTVCNAAIDNPGTYGTDCTGIWTPTALPVAEDPAENPYF